MATGLSVRRLSTVAGCLLASVQGRAEIGSFRRGIVTCHWQCAHRVSSWFLRAAVQSVLMKPRVSFVQRANGLLAPVVVVVSRLDTSIGFTFMALPCTDPIVLMSSKTKNVLGMNQAATKLFKARDHSRRKPAR